MRHQVVEHILDDYGYRETLGEEVLYDAFEEYLRATKKQASAADASDFLDWWLSTQNAPQHDEGGAGGQSEPEYDSSGDSDGGSRGSAGRSHKAAAQQQRGRGHKRRRGATTIIRDSESESEGGSAGEEEDGSDEEMGSASSSSSGDSDVELLEDDTDNDVIECSSDSDAGAGPAKQQQGQQQWQQRPGLSAAGAPGAAAPKQQQHSHGSGGKGSSKAVPKLQAVATAAAAPKKRQGAITSFLQALPKGVPSSAGAAELSPRQPQQQAAGAAAGGRGASASGRLPALRLSPSNGQQQQQAQQAAQQGGLGWAASRPATAEELALNDLDYANLVVFGNRAFRPRQREVVQAALSGHDCFVLMPTGGGKSLTYQLPAVLSRGVSVVVTPLLSLMQDQVQALCALPCGGVPTTYLSSQQTAAESKAVFLELCKPQPTVKLLYVTPEQLVKGARLKDTLQQLYSRGLLSRIVVDEAHCVSAWGHDFRPDYKQLGMVRETHFPQVPVMALTATATHKVRSDITSSLRMRAPRTFQVSFFRDNLTFSVVDKDYEVSEETNLPAYMDQMLTYIHERRDQTGIVYCLTRDESEQVAACIRERVDVPAAHYHAGMTPAQRMAVQNDWREGRTQVVVATIAFGMGIDKADVRYVLHFTLSKSMEGYYQEAGRAGRDGLPSECILYYARRDVPRIIQMLRGKQFRRGMELLDEMKSYCSCRDRCRHAVVLQYFGETFSKQSCGDRCDNCRGENKPKQAGAAGGSKARAGGRKAGAAAKVKSGGGGSGSGGGSGTRLPPAQAAAAAAFQRASTLLPGGSAGGSRGPAGGSQRQQQAGPSGSARALKMVQKAGGLSGGGSGSGSAGPQAKKPAAAAPAGFITAATALQQQQQQQQQKPPRPPKKAGAAAKPLQPQQSNTLWPIVQRQQQQQEKS